MLRRGVKEVVKGLRKGEKGIVIMAGDISPIDVISHLPVLCEDSDVPYVFVQSKVRHPSCVCIARPSFTPRRFLVLQAELGAASSTKRPTSCLLVTPKDGFSAQDKFDAAVTEIKKITPVF